MIRLTIVLAVTWSICTGCTKRNEITVPTIAPITEAVFASGSIKPVDEIVVTSSAEGYVEVISIQENDIVEKGEVVCVLENRQSTINVQSATRTLAIARENLRDDSPVLAPLHADLITARRQYSSDSVQYSRFKSLYDTKSVSKLELESVDLRAQSAQAKVLQATKNIEATRNRLRQDLISAQQQYDLAVSGADNYYIISPGIFRVFQVLKREGEYVRKGEAVALLGHADSLFAELSIDETAIEKVAIGQKVLIELNTHPNEMLEGKVEQVLPYFQEISQSYTLRVSLKNCPDRIIAGSLLQANIVVGSKARALLIPRSFLSADQKVIRISDGKADTVSVKTGIISNEWVEVVEGISPDDEIMKI